MPDLWRRYVAPLFGKPNPVEALTDDSQETPDPLREAAMRLLDSLDSSGDLPKGWTLGHIAGRETGRG